MTPENLPPTTPPTPHPKALTTLLLLLLLLSHSPLPSSAKKITTLTPSLLVIQPLNFSLPQTHLHALKLHLKRQYKLNIRLLPPRPIPNSTYRKKSRRHRAEKICAFLASQKPPHARFILGVTSLDISTNTKHYADHAVFGLADRGGPAAILSTFRLRKTPQLRKHFPRLWKQLAIHEVGHLLGLTHCPQPNCVMHNANSQPHTLKRMSTHLCTRCKKKLAQHPKPTQITPHPL